MAEPFIKPQYIVTGSRGQRTRLTGNPAQQSRPDPGAYDTSHQRNYQQIQENSVNRELKEIPQNYRERHQLNRSTHRQRAQNLSFLPQIILNDRKHASHGKDSAERQLNTSLRQKLRRFPYQHQKRQGQRRQEIVGPSQIRSQETGAHHDDGPHHGR